MSKPLFSSGIVAKAIPEERVVKALFEQGSASSPAITPAPEPIKGPAPLSFEQKAPESSNFFEEKKPVVEPEVKAAPLTFKPTEAKQQQPVSAVFKGVRSFTDQANEEITAVIPSATFNQIEFLQSIVVDYYKMGFSVWQAYFTKIGRENVDMSEDLHTAVTTVSGLNLSEVIKTGTNYVSGGSGGFFGIGKKSYDEVFSVLNAALAPRDQIRTTIKGLKTRVDRIQKQVRLILDVVPNMPSVTHSDKVIQYLTPLESSILMFGSEIQLFEANFERDISAVERLLFSQMPAMRSRT